MIPSTRVSGWSARRAKPFAIGLGAAVLVIGGAACGSKKSAPTTVAAGASLQQLVSLSQSVGHAIYWAGPQAGRTYEATKTRDGRVYVRYLPHGVAAGDPAAKYLAIGTYPQANATVVLKATAKKQGQQLIVVPGGGVAFVSKSHPTSVYVAYPGANYQVEVFDPSPSVARALVTSGKVVPVVAASVGRAPAKAVTAAELKALSTRAGHPIYWAGSEPDVTYELTQTSDGRIYVRYLPRGVKVGDSRPNYLTVGTYPESDAVARLRNSARAAHGGTIELAGGAVAYIAKNRPTSVYIARPGENVLIEVFDPSAERARQLATSGAVQPVP